MTDYQAYNIETLSFQRVERPTVAKFVVENFFSKNRAHLQLCKLLLTTCNWNEWSQKIGGLYRETES